MFKQYFKEEKIQTPLQKVEEKTEKEIDKTISEIRKKLKIKSIVPTKFGFQVDFFNPNDAKEAAKMADTSKISGNSIMVEGIEGI